MSDWIGEKRNEIKEVFKDNMDNEHLFASAVYVYRLLNALEQMQKSVLYYYQKEILYEPMKTFTSYYIQQVKDYLSEESALKKMRILGDIQIAVSQIVNVFKTVVDNTANADRHMFSSFSVEANVYDLSPKLFVYYSKILRVLSKVYSMENVYAFFLYPTLKSTVQTENLFKEREKRGKPVLICIPENKIEKVNIVPIYLLHEAYHVLSRNERCREIRAECISYNIASALEEVLFEQVHFENDKFINDKIIEKLWYRWYKKDEYSQEYEERFYYGNHFMEHAIQKWTTILQNVACCYEEDIFEVINDVVSNDIKEQGLGAICTYYEEGKEQLKRNLNKILCGNWLTFWVYQHMGIYREVYADLACILTLQIEPDKYEKVFYENVPRDLWDGEIINNDLQLYWRMYVVSLVVQEAMGKKNLIDLATKWGQYANKMLIRIHGVDKNETAEESQQEGYEVLNFNITDREAYLAYLRACAEKIEDTLDRCSHINAFRLYVKETEMIDIVSGTIFMELDEILTDDA